MLSAVKVQQNEYIILCTLSMGVANTCIQILIKFISIGSYFPEVRAFDTLIMSTKVFRLILCKTL